MDDLEPDTDYVVRAYMDYRQSDDTDSTPERVYSTEINFRTPALNGGGGMVPGNDNNNPPVVN